MAAKATIPTTVTAAAEIAATLQPLPPPPPPLTAAPANPKTQFGMAYGSKKTNAKSRLIIPVETGKGELGKRKVEFNHFHHCFHCGLHVDFMNTPRKGKLVCLSKGQCQIYLSWFEYNYIATEIPKLGNLDKNGVPKHGFSLEMDNSNSFLATIDVVSVSGVFVMLKCLLFSKAGYYFVGRRGGPRISPWRPR